MCAANTSNGSGLGVDVSLEENAPHCPHGPTLLFTPFTNTKKRQKYYACSACRDRKECSFFQLYTGKASVAKPSVSEDRSTTAQKPWTSHEEHYHRLEVTQRLDVNQRQFCLECNLLLHPKESKHHSKHNVKSGLTDKDLSMPTYLLSPLENNKTNAQYLFSKKATHFLSSAVKDLGFKRVLCIGAPRIHELIQTNKSLKLESLLLDIDHRYGQFYPPHQFCRYNMFNNYFFEGDPSRAVCREFLHRNHGDGVAVVIDPPFGGRVEVLAEVIRILMVWWKDGRKADQSTCPDDLPTLWIFPYFLEPRINESLSSFSMLDYKVEYDNHPLYQSKKKPSKKGSPVRIFTNVEPAKFALPAGEGYRFCDVCNRYVSKENVHCRQCNSCTSKDGSTYTHCLQCDRCVKPAYVHCDSCQRCELPNHLCNRLSVGCHICGSPNHKRRDCPVGATATPNKRMKKGIR